MNIQSRRRGEPEMKLLDFVKIGFFSTVIMTATGFQTGRFLWKNDNKIALNRNLVMKKVINRMSSLRGLNSKKETQI